MTLSASYSRSRLHWDEFQPLFDEYREQYGEEGAAIAEQYDVDDKRSELIAVGARYDPGDWFAMVEWAQSESDTFIADSRGWYATYGHRIVVFTPYLTLAEVEATSRISHPEDPNDDLLSMATEQERVSVGTRWDFAPSAAAKFQLDYIDLDQGSPGVLINEGDEFERGDIVRVFSTSVDFVF